MPMLTPPPLPVDMLSWKRLSRAERIRPLAVNWVENGAALASPMIYALYIVKIIAFVVGGLFIFAATPGIGGVTDVASWWHEPIVYQKLIIYIWIFEMMGLGGSFGPLTMKMLPPLVAPLHWFRAGTIRQPPWPRVVPLTKGDRRSGIDVLLAAVAAGLMVWLLASSGTGPVPPGASVGLLDKQVVLALVVTMLVIGLRDKVLYLASRSDVYLVSTVIFLFPYGQMMIGLKLALVAVWIGAGVSKLTHVFPYVVTVMTSNAPLRPKWFKRALFRDPVNDLRPSRFAFLFAHSGTAVELVLPVVLLVSLGGTVSLVAVTIMVLFHLYIISNVPIAVPNEWNVFMAAAAIFLFWSHADVSVAGLSNPLLIALLGLGVLGPVVLGNIRPDLISFVIAMRYYAGTWPSSLWCFRGESWRRLSPNITKAAGLAEEQMERIYGPDHGLIARFKLSTFRSFYPAGQALNGLLRRAVDDVEAYVVIEGEMIGSALNGWNMGDGHMHNEQLLAAVQKRCGFAPGELVLVHMESQPLFRQRMAYRIVDAAAGQLEAGTVPLKPMLQRQPWDDARVPVRVTSATVAPAALRDPSLSAGE
jgi:hypothetical protein